MRSTKLRARTPALGLVLALAGCPSPGFAPAPDAAPSPDATRPDAAPDAGPRSDAGPTPDAGLGPDDAGLGLIGPGLAPSVGRGESDRFRLRGSIRGTEPSTTARFKLRGSFVPISP